jgi:DNA-binding NarL/FixJ family response regulator
LLRTHNHPQRFVESLALLMFCKGTNYHNDLLTPVPATLAEALQHGEEALQVARASGQRTLEAYVLVYMACCLGPHGNYARAIEAIQAGLTILQEFEHQRWLIDAHWIQGALYLDLLAPTLAQEHLEHALALAHEVDTPGWERMVTSLLALAYLQQQDLVRAESTLGMLRNPQTRRTGQRMAWCARAELALAQGNPGLALEIVEQLIKSVADLSRETVIPRLAHLRGRALLLLQRPEEAERMLQEANAAAQQQGTVSRQWRIAIDLGALYLAQQRGDEAARAFAAAQHMIEELATSIPHQSLREHFLARATALLPPSQTRQPRRRGGPLTDREREVVRLLAQGLTNQQIAASLAVSERTVNSHLVRIFNKLGVNNRAAAATYAVRQGLIE